MKLKNISDEELIKECLNNNQIYQKKLYDKFSPKMYGICLRYCKNTAEAKDVLQDTFIKVFNSLKSFKFDGLLEAWVRRITVNTAINHYNSKKTLNELDIEQIENSNITNPNESIEDYLNIIQKLPRSFRMVVNLYIIEGYNHREIGEMLNISESTSKSQLSRARIKLQKEIENFVT